MSNFYSGGSPLPTGLSRTAKTPIDTALNVEDLAQRTALEAYYVVGDEVYVQSEDKKYKRTAANGWEEIGTPNSDWVYKGTYNAKIDATHNGTPGQTNPELAVGTAVTITNAVDNGGGLIRISAASHGLSTSDNILIENVTGTVEANAEWTVTVIDANTVDLQGSTFSNAYISGGTLKPIGDRKDAAAGAYWRVSQSYTDLEIAAAAAALTAIDGYAVGSDASAMTYAQLEEAGLIFSADASAQLGTFKTAVAGESGIANIAALKAVIDGVITGGITTTQEDRRNTTIDGNTSYSPNDQLVLSGTGANKKIARVLNSNNYDLSVSWSDISDGVAEVSALIANSAAKQWASSGVSYDAGQIVYNDVVTYIDVAPALRATSVVVGAVTIIIVANHGLSTSNTVKLTGFGGLTGVNDLTHVITVIDANSFTIAVDTSGDAYTVGGTILRQTTYRTYYQAKQSIGAGGNTLPTAGARRSVDWEVISSQNPNIFGEYDNEVALANTATNGEYLDAVGKYFDANEIAKRFDAAAQDSGDFEGGLLV